jgi:uncharacterized protein YbjT (DUF2867 family)
MSNSKNVLVAGASGTTGRIVIDLLKKSDHYTPIAMVRKQEQVEEFEKNHVSTVHADLTEGLSDVVSHADLVLFAAGSGGKEVIEVDQEGAKNLTDAAKKADIKKFVMLSSMGADDPSKNEGLKDYLIAKQNADDHLRASGLLYSIVRPGALTNEGHTGTIELKEKLGTQGSISRADVAQTLIEVLDQNVMKNQTFEIISGSTPISQALQTA